MDHDLGGFALCITIGLIDQRNGNQTVAVIAQGMAHVAQLAGSISFAVQPRTGVNRGFVGVVAAALIFKVAAITITITTIIASVLETKALVPSPSLG